MFSKIATALLLGIAWGVSVILMKFAAQSGMDIFQIIFLSTLGVAAVLSVYLKLTGRSFFYQRSFFTFGLVCAIFAYLIPEFLSISALRHISAGLLSIVLTTVPIFTYLLAVLAGEDEVQPRKIIGLIIGFIAVCILLVSKNSFSLKQINSWLLISFLISVSYAIYEVFASKKWPAKYDSVEVAFGESVFVGLLTIPLLALNFDVQKTVNDLSHHYWIILMLIALWSLERIIFFTAIKNGGAVYASQASYIAPPVSIILGMVFFDEPLEIILWLCFVIILFAVTLISSVSKHVRKP